MELKEVFNGLLSKVYQFDNDGVTSLFNEDGTVKDDTLDVILQKDAERVASLKPDTKKIQDDFYKKGMSESLSDFEKRIATKYALKTDKKGLEFIDELIEKYKDSSADMNDDEKVKKSKIFIDELEKWNAEKTELQSKFTNDFDTYKKQVEKDRLFTLVSGDALVEFENMKPILPDDAQKAANLKKVFINELAAMDYEIRDGKKILKDKEGNDLTDSHGNRIPFEVFVKQTAEKYFEFYKADDKNAPNHKQNSNSNKPLVYVINSEADFIAYNRIAKTAEERVAILDAYNDAKAKGKF